jgi:L-serine dehydratase
MFKIGIGPSSSHTVGPMKAALFFLRRHDVNIISHLRATLYGSLAWTGRGHGTDKAILLGFSGEAPDTVNPDIVESFCERVRTEKLITLPTHRVIPFDPSADIIFNTTETFKQHSNAVRFESFDRDGTVIANEVWFSIGGGFVRREGDSADRSADIEVPFPFSSAAQLMEMGEEHKMSFAQIAYANEDARRPRKETVLLIEDFLKTMLACITRGLSQDGLLPGGLKVRRRAKGLYEKVEMETLKNSRLPNGYMDHVSAFAIAVNEENAAGGRVVTAPTNGAAGIIPAVLRYYLDFCPGANREGVNHFFLVAALIGSLIKHSSSISGAEVGCQGEVGSAAAMAAAGLAAALGGTNAQVENAAEIAMEHHLGMTCDPVGGLVQIPCIERNAFGAVKAINAASLALHGDGTHRISLDQVIETMRQTGADMQSKYKETSQGGLAVNATEC